MVTLLSSSWGVRKAFERLLIRPYRRMRKLMFPVAVPAFKAQQDERENYVPIFRDITWEPRSKYAAYLGEDLEPPQLAAPHPAGRLDYLKPQANDDAVTQRHRDALYAGPGPDDEPIPF